MISYEKGNITVIEAGDKIRITKGKYSYHCDLNNGEAVILPLTYGDGEYILSIYQRIKGTTYRLLKKRTVSASGTFEYLSQYNTYVPFTTASKTAQMVAKGMDEHGAYKAIRKWVQRSIVYDFIKAATVGKGAIPDPQACFDKRMGICQDIASLAVSMMRSVGIKSRLVIGNADGKYHAWAEALIGWKVYRFDYSGSAKSYVRERWY